MGRTENPRLDKVVARLGELPAVPEVVAEALRRIDDPAGDTKTISEVIEQDPALAAQVLRLSNSAYYGLKRQVGTVKLAVVVLGTRELRNIVLAAAAYTAALEGQPQNRLAQHLWRHSLLVAGICKKMGRQMRLGLEGEDFVAGLLHDIGKLVLWCRQRTAYEPILREARETHKPVSPMELGTFGFTHADVAAVLGRRWMFPDALVDALWLHHPQSQLPLDEATDPCLAALVRVSNLAAQADSDVAADSEAWTVLDNVPAAIAVNERGPLMALFREELESAPIPTK